MVKICIRCEKEKEVEDFYKHLKTKDGRNSWCKECCKSYAYNYDKLRPDRWKDWCNKNQEKQKLARKRWRKNNKERVRLEKRKSEAKRNALKRLCKEHFTINDVLELLELQGNKCYYCGVSLKEYQIEHKIPISRGGENGRENICMSCSSCNRKKHTKTEREFLNAKKD